MKKIQMKKNMWYKVRINESKKTFKISNTTFKTKKEGVSTLKNKQYIIANVKVIDKLIGEGYTEYSKEVGKVENDVKIVSEPIDLTGDEKVEAEIKAYELKMDQKELAKQAKIESDIIAYEKKMEFKESQKNNKGKINKFLYTANHDSGLEKFEYNKKWEQQYKRELKEKEELAKEYIEREV